MSRVIWKGSVSFGLVDIPVTVHPAEKRERLSFTLLDRRNMAPVGYEKINKETGEEVPYEEIVKGYEYAEGDYVVLQDGDFEKANVEATQTIEISDFVDAAEIPIEHFERPYYLAPTKKKSKGYALLRETLRKHGKVAVATVVLRARQHLCAVLVRGDALLLELLRYGHELRDPSGLDLPGGDLEELGITKKELEMAGKLVEGMAGEWDPSRYRDEYRDDLLELIEKKAGKGETEPVAVAGPKPKKESGVIDIMDLLKRSVERNKKKPRSKKSA